MESYQEERLDLEFLKFTFREIYKEDTVSLKDRKNLEIKEKEINSKSDDEVSLKFFED
jgi:hypothetical protein